MGQNIFNLILIIDINQRTKSSDGKNWEINSLRHHVV